MLDFASFGEQQHQRHVRQTSHLMQNGAHMSTIAIVTGASSGLGREFVRCIDGGLMGHVDEIWAIARRSERLEALVRTCTTPVRPFCLDLCDLVSFDILESALAEEHAHVALLVNNAGFGVFGSVIHQKHTDAARMVELLMRAPVELTYRALPYMTSGSRIINVSSVAAFMPQPNLAVYAAAKRFVLDFSLALDAELEDVNIRSTAVCPKFMKTEFLQTPGDAGIAEQFAALVGYERVEDVARKAIFAARAGRTLCIPSADMKLFYAASKVLPYKLALAVERALL